MSIVEGDGRWLWVVRLHNQRGVCVGSPLSLSDDGRV